MGHVTATRNYAGVTADERRARRRAALIEAGVELLGTRGFTDTTVTAVCAASGVTERYFYENFAGRDALLAAVYEHLLVITQRAVIEAVLAAPGSADAKARAAIGAFVDLVVADPRLARIGFVESLAHPTLRALRQTSLLSFSELVVAQAADLYGPALAEQTEQVRLAALLLTGGLFETLVHWLDGHLALTRDEVVDRCARIFAAVGDSFG